MWRRTYLSMKKTLISFALGTNTYGNFAFNMHPDDVRTLDVPKLHPAARNRKHPTETEIKSRTPSNRIY